jgi:hypothetical protein
VLEYSPTEGGDFGRATCRTHGVDDGGNYRGKDPHDRRKVIVETIADRQAELDLIYQAPGRRTITLLEKYADPELAVVLDFFIQITDLSG